MRVRDPEGRALDGPCRTDRDGILGLLVEAKMFQVKKR